jgi:hypothetical protein
LKPAPLRAAPPPPAPEPDESSVPPTTSAPRAQLINVPSPPPRPFNLGAIERAIAPVASVAAMPPRRPIRQASAGERSLYFGSNDEPVARLLQRDDPFAKLIEQGELPRLAGAQQDDR